MLDLYEPLSGGVCDRGSARLDIELGADIPDVVGHHVMTYEQLVRDLAIPPPSTDQAQNIQLSLGQHLAPVHWKVVVSLVTRGTCQSVRRRSHRDFPIEPW